MSNYTKTTNFAAKDDLASGNANKIVKGAEIDTEFNNIATAVATKANTAGAALTGDVTITGTTPSLTIGDGGAEDTVLVFDGNAQDFYIGLDDSADDLVIGLGSSVGTTPAIEIDENQDIKFAQSIGVGQAASSTVGDITAQTMSLKGTTPTLTIGDGGAEDTKIVFDGNAKDFYIGLDDSADKLVIGEGSTVGTSSIITLTDGTATVSNDLKLDSDSAVLGFGADNDTTLTHTDGSGLTLNSTNKIMFNDASQFIQGSSATVLALGATDEIDLTATAIDVNGTMDVSGALTGTTAVFTSADNLAVLTVRSTDADASLGPLIVFDRESSSPADGDLVGRLIFQGENDVGEDTTYARIHAGIVDASDGTEDGLLQVASMLDGTVVSRMEMNATETVFNEGSKDLNFRVESDNNDSMFVVNASSDRVHIGSSSAISVGSNMDFTIQGQDGGAGVSIVKNSNDTTGPSIQFAKSRGTAVNATTVVQDGDTLGTINFRGADGTDLNTLSARISAQVDGTPGSNAMPGRLIFETNDSSGTATTEVFRIDSNQTAHFGTTDGAAISSTATRVNITGTNRALDLYRPTSAGTNIVFAAFSDVGGTKTKVFEVEASGDIETATGSIGTISDQRLKQDIVDANSQWSDIKALQIRNFKFINDVNQNGENALRHIGVVAQEVESSGMTGLVKTKIDEDTGEEIKSVKSSIIYMKAVKALQEAIARIETLEAEVTALKGG